MKKLRYYLAAVAAMLPTVAFAQFTSADQILSTTESTLSGLGATIINIVSIAMGLGAVVMLGINLVKYLRNDPSTSDSLTKVGAGLLIAVVLLQIIKYTLLGG